MKATESGKQLLCFFIAAGLLVSSSALADGPPLPPLPPGAPPAARVNPADAARRAVPGSPFANPFAVPAPPVAARPPATPTPLAPQLPLAPPRAVSQPIAMATMPVADPNALKWDAELKEYTTKPGEANAPFTFWLTNVSSSEVLINNVRTSCGCTVAKLPSQPWRIPPGSNGPIEVAVNLAGKGGTIAKGVTVESSVGTKMLTVKVNITPGVAGPVAGMGDTERLKNMQMALADRQVVFKKEECAKCHAEPVKGKMSGMQVYAGACAICHDSHLRAALVPDLRNLNHPADAEHWRKWITYGRPGSMMPAFAESEGGPLTQAQIEVLVHHLTTTFPSGPRRAAPTKTEPQSAADSSSVSVFPTPKAN